ncbi:membrane-bound lytic murein transglycosylase D [Marinobacterium halophilum]|uniref:Membrane-bound lytic murein transglycosylase D n=1 Tax=Marinobacterium halophilum TaxID=267374 RepID=A0A2P8F0D2_9GAMM|nr:LysM peptidoglycan-binding domain-containing protein [Marinobacterium halophilum]PSL15177.1 membrane-bound lytic murein transglycosylase D [Marinobacterium halophilum]
MRRVPAPLLAAMLGMFLVGCQTASVQPQSARVAPTDQTLASLAGKNRAEASKPDQQPEDLWALSRQHMQLPLDLEHPRIQTQLNWYQRHPSHLLRVTERAQPYYYYILNEVLKRDMPAEMALLPMIESAYDPFAYSHARAAGPWQFIPGTARHFGLRTNWWYDGRRDIVASTDAALTYLQQLHKRFDGDWLLALAAYNAGGGTVNRAMRRNREKGQPTDFWSLDLPRETQAYVPKLLAVARVIRDADTLDLAITPVANRPHFAMVETGGQIDLAQVASMAEMELKTLYRLNPGFNRWATDPEGPHKLLIPVEKAEQLRERLSALPIANRVSWHHYKVKPGDTLSTIAQRFNSSTRVIRQGNRLKGNLIRVGQSLVVPKPGQTAEHYALSEDQRKQAKIKQLEQRHDNTLYHAVGNGESFWSIARRYGVSVRELARWNQMAPGDTLRTGQKLLVLNATAATTDSTPRMDLAVRDARDMVRKVGYRIRRGDSLSRIANRFSVSIDDILSWNSLTTDTLLRPGQPLTLYINIADAG